MVALNEEVPLTSTAMGIATEESMAELRQRYSQIVCLKNNIGLGLIQCDCCLSQKPQEKNPILFCQLCLSGVHVKCHSRRLLYSYSEDMTDFICERCRYIIDNGPDPSEIKLKFQCRFCNEEKGILVYIDKHSQSINN